MDRRRFVQLLLAGSSSELGVLLAASAPMTAQSNENSVRRRLRFTLTFANPLAHALEDQTFWCYLPARISPAHRLREVQVTMPHRLLDDVLGHCILELSFDHFPALAQKIVTVTAEVEFLAARQLQALEDTFSWLQAERFIESDDDRMRALGLELRRSTPVETARAIYDWVQGNMTYAGYLAEDLGALQALLQRRGDCTEYADLVVALARANAIPARMVGGYVVDRDLAPRPQDYHNWAELYLDGNWRLIDAQKGNWFKPADQYVAFRIYRDASINPVGLAHRFRMQGNLHVGF